VIVALFIFGGELALANNAPTVTGSYEVVQSTDFGSQKHVRIRIHLENHGPNSLSIQRMTLWDFSHPDKGGTQACAVSLRAHASVETTQEFTIRRSDYQLWQKGVRPRIVLQMPGPGKTKSTTVVRLDRIASRETK
jgi:hypothetical protein